MEDAVFFHRFHKIDAQKPEEFRMNELYGIEKFIWSSDEKELSVRI